MSSCRIPEREAPASGGGPARAAEEAKAAACLCFATVFCAYCDVCRLLCPDLCITRDTESGRIVIDLDYCKGCGLCAHFCPKGAITMTIEKR